MENPEIAKNYSCNGALSLGVDDCVKFEESQIKNGLKDFFNSEDCDASILFLSGHGSKNTFYLETNQGDKPLTYEEIAQYWINRKSKNTNKSLLIIIDACYSGSWAIECDKNLHFASHYSISVQSSCQEDKVSSDNPRKGGYLIFNLVQCQLGKFNLDETKDCPHEPRSCGFFNQVRKNFGLYAMVNSWNEFNVKNIQFVDYNDGARYEGEFKDGKRHGKRVYFYTDGGRYEGEFKDYKRHGKGVYFFNDGARYEGEFKVGIKHGKGVYFYNDGGRYEGEFEDDKGHGKGVYFYQVGHRYEGEFKDWNNHGKGVLFNKSGDKYEGSGQTTIRDNLI